MQSNLIQNAFKFFISRFIPAVSLTIIAVIYSRVLSNEDYGKYQMVWTYLNVSVVLTSFGIPKFILSHRNKSSFLNFVKAFVIVLILFLIPITFFLFYGQNHIDSRTSLALLILLISQTFYFFQEAIYLSDNSGNRIIDSNLLYAVLILFVHLWAIFNNSFSLSWCIFGIAISSIIRNIHVWDKYTTKIKFSNFGIENSRIPISQLFLLGFNEVLSIVSKWIDKIILIFLLTPSDYSIYFNGTFELPVIGMVLLAFQLVILSYSSNQENEEVVLKNFKESSKLLSSVLFPLFFLLIFYSNDIVLLLFGDRYKEAIQLFALSSLLLPVRICNYTVLLQLKDKGKEIVLGSLFDMLLAFVLMVLLYPIWGLNSLVIAIVFATYFQAGYYLYQISKAYNVSILEVLPIQFLITRFITTGSVFVLLFQLSRYNNTLSFGLGIFALLLMVAYFNRNLIRTIVIEIKSKYSTK